MSALSRLTPASLFLLTFACDADSSIAVDDVESTEDDEFAELADDAQERPDRIPDGVDLAAPRDPAAAAVDCCATGSAACSDLVVAECVCTADPYCCDVQWDSLCVSEVDSLGCGTCAAEIACCEASSLPGCEDSSTASCVCDVDPYCCGNQWDSTCVSLVESLGCGSCDPVDLVITEGTAPAEACVGQDIASLVSLDVTNDGGDAISETFNVAWYLSDDPHWGSGDSLLLGGRDQISGGLAGGSTVSLSSSANQVPWTATLGPQYLLAVVDEFDTVSERDELNNVLARPIEITGTGPCVSATGWLKRLGGTGGERVPIANAVAVDKRGNVYVVGTTLGSSFNSHVPTIDLGQGPETTQQTDGFIVAYEPDGTYRWSRLFSGVGDDRATGVAVDSEDRLYVLLTSTGPLDTGMGETPVTGPVDTIVASFHHDGWPRWTNRYGAAGGSVGGQALAANEAGELAVVGYIRGAGTDFGGGPLPGTLPNTPSPAFVLGLHSSGSHRFSRQLAAADADRISGVDINSAGEILAVGKFKGTVDYGAGPLTSAGGYDGFALKLDAAGDSLWSESFGGAQADEGVGALLDDAGIAYATGTVDEVRGWADAFADTVVLAYDASGTPMWERHGGGASTDRAGGLAMNTAGELVVTGWFNTSWGTVTTANYADQILTTGNSGAHLVLAGYDPVDGAGLWAELYETNDDIGASAFGKSMAASPAGNVVVVGELVYGTLTAQGSSVTTVNEMVGDEVVGDEPDVFILSTTP